MARPFVTNIDEANTLIAKLDTDISSAQVQINDLTTKAKTATDGVTQANETLAEEKKRADEAEAALVKSEEEKTKINNDLKVARETSVKGAAAPGVPPIKGAAEEEKKPVEELTGRARSVAAMATMQPNFKR